MIVAKRLLGAVKMTVEHCDRKPANRKLSLQSKKLVPAMWNNKCGKGTTPPWFAQKIRLNNIFHIGNQSQKTGFNYDFGAWLAII